MSIFKRVTDLKKVSELCDMAIADMVALKSAMKEGGLVFSASTWHTQFGGNCHMCVAGAVARGCGVPDTSDWAMGDSCDESVRRFDILDELRFNLPINSIERSFGLPFSQMSDSHGELIDAANFIYSQHGSIHDLSLIHI